MIERDISDPNSRVEESRWGCTMERLSVSNFLSIKEVSIEIAPITIVIGPQASGKSVLAKLIYFFRTILTEDVRQFIVQELSFEKFKEAIQEKFVNSFPVYGWLDIAFRITYVNDDVNISLSHKHKSKTIVVDISDEFESLVSATATKYKSAIDKDHVHEQELNQGSPSAIKFQLSSAIYLELRNSKPELFRQPFFIPASRSIYHVVKPNVFNLLSARADFDPIFVRFAAIYETAKKRYDDARWKKQDGQNRFLSEKVREARRSILCGDYLNEKDQDWIRDAVSERKTALANASSGQQEALPMLAVLSLYAFAVAPIAYFIEEPEAHLFPTTQKSIVSLIGLLHNNRRQNFFLTTHSPYILTAFNILIASSDALARNEKRKRKIPEFIDESTAIPFRDISAYSLKGGTVADILDRSACLIGSSVIDEVSDEFEELFEKILLWRNGEELR